MTTETIDDLISNFELLDDWEDRYRYLIELGNELPEMPENLRTSENKVQGCASQVWLSTEHAKDASDQTILNFTGDSDAHIVKGLIAVLLKVYSGQTPQTIEQTNITDILNQLGLKEHLTPQRSNGFASMVERVKRDAKNAA